jgi:A/G-specific adenine glycosylase
VNLLKIRESEVPKFRRRLLAWFAARKRDLPWRQTRDPYHIWVSEIMLQQTRVAAVIPHYERFLKTFPDARSLARADEDRVLANWAGLGYYSRARNLQRAAKEIVSRHAAEFPRQYDAALALPGVGRYTAAAVLSIAYDAPFAVLDGNVARVLARLGAIRGEPRSPAKWRRLESAAQGLLARNAPGDWNQAMMELGATVCTPKSPKCSDCPVERWCRARKLGIAERVPPTRNKRPTVHVTLTAAVLLDPCGRTLLVRYPGGDGALFSRMWQFPAIQTFRANEGILKRYLLEKFGVDVNGDLASLPTSRHTVTFRDVRLKPYLARLGTLPKVKGARITSLDRVRSLPISNATRKIADAASRHAQSE